MPAPPTRAEARMTFIVIGVDGGGSKTRVIVADEQGAQLGEVDGPASAVRPGEAERSADVIARRRARRARVVRDDARRCRRCSASASPARAASRSARRSGRRSSSRELAEEVVVHADFIDRARRRVRRRARRAADQRHGSVAFGRGPTGTIARCGGWGPVCGDEGSGAWIGRRALSVVTAAADGREPETALTARCSPRRR